MTNDKKTVVIGVTGSVGSVNLISYIAQLNTDYNLRLIFTPNALEFVNSRGFEPFIQDFHTDLFVENRVLHTDLAYSADAFLILPASANTISKMAHAIADNLLTSALLVYDKPVIIAANMNPNMWNNPIFQDNIKYLQTKGHIFINERKKAIRAHDKKVVWSDACLPSPDKINEYLRKYTE